MINKWKTLYQKYADARETIKTEYFNHAIQSLNSLYNATFDDHSPGHSLAGNFTYAGHNHQIVPLTRGCVYSEIGGNLPLWSVSFTKSPEGNMARKILNSVQYDASYKFNTFACRPDYISRHYASANINGGFLEGRMACGVLGSDFVVYFGEGLPNRGELNKGKLYPEKQPFSIKVNQNTDEGSSFVSWYNFKVPFKEGTLNGLPEMFVLNTQNAPCSFSLYSIIIDEVPGISHVRDGQTGWAL